MPGPARAKVKVNGGVILAASQICISRIVHKTQAAPNAAVKVAAGVLEEPLKSADGEIMADPSLYLEQAQPRGHGYAGGQGHANSGQPIIVAVLIAEAELAFHRRAA